MASSKDSNKPSKLKKVLQRLGSNGDSIRAANKNRDGWIRRYQRVVAILTWLLTLIVIALINDRSILQRVAWNDADGGGAAQASSHKKHAYVFLVGGVDEQEPSSYYYMYDVMISAYLLRQDKTQSDIVAMVQMGPDSKQKTLSPKIQHWLGALEVKIQYIPPVAANNRYSIMMEKFRILGLTQYRRVLFLDADAIPLGNLDYLFELSEAGVLKENLIVPGLRTPASGGFFMLAPDENAMTEVQALIQQKEQAAAASPDDIESLFDPVLGWGHVITSPDEWVRVGGTGREWDFVAAYADQGLIYYWAKYYRKSTSIILADKIQNWGPHPTNESDVVLETTILSDDVFRGQHQAKYRNITENCWRWCERSCYPPMSDFEHWAGKKRKPWIIGPPSDLSVTTRTKSAVHLWFYVLHVLNMQLDMGLDETLHNWPYALDSNEKQHWVPPVGYHLTPDHQKGVQTILVNDGDKKDK